MDVRDALIHTLAEEMVDLRQFKEEVKVFLAPPCGCAIVQCEACNQITLAGLDYNHFRTFNHVYCTVKDCGERFYCFTCMKKLNILRTDDEYGDYNSCPIHAGEN